MPVPISLSEFLETGFFGPVELGMTKSEVESVLGPPDAVGAGSRKQREPLWKYGSFELHFDPKSGQLERVFADGFETLEGGARLALDGPGLTGSATRAQVERTLAEAGIGFARTLHPWDEGTCELVTLGLVALLFTAPEEAPGADPSAYRLTALSSTDSVVVAEAHDRQDAKRMAAQWQAAHPELAREVPADGWILDAYPEDDGRTLFRMRAEFAPEPAPVHPPHSHD